MQLELHQPRPPASRKPTHRKKIQGVQDRPQQDLQFGIRPAYLSLVAVRAR